MIVLYILLALLGLILLLLLIPVQVGLEYRDELLVWLRYGFIKMTLYSSEQEKKEKKKKPSKKAKAKKSRKAIHEKKASFSDRLSEIFRDLKEDGVSEAMKEAQTLVHLAGQMVKRLRRMLTVDRLYLSVTVATGEADTTAIRYGQACAVLYPAQAALENLLRVRKSAVQVTPRFDREHSEAAAVVRVHTSLLSVAIVLLGTFMGLTQWPNLLGIKKG